MHWLSWQLGSFHQSSEWLLSLLWVSKGYQSLLQTWEERLIFTASRTQNLDFYRKKFHYICLLVFFIFKISEQSPIKCSTKMTKSNHYMSQIKYNLNNRKTSVNRHRHRRAKKDVPRATQCHNKPFSLPFPTTFYGLKQLTKYPSPQEINT